MEFKTVSDPLLSPHTHRKRDGGGGSGVFPLVLKMSLLSALLKKIVADGRGRG